MQNGLSLESPHTIEEFTLLQLKYPKILGDVVFTEKRNNFDGWEEFMYRGNERIYVAWNEGSVYFKFSSSRILTLEGNDVTERYTEGDDSDTANALQIQEENENPFISMSVVGVAHGGSGSNRKRTAKQKSIGTTKDITGKCKKKAKAAGARSEINRLLSEDVNSETENDSLAAGDTESPHAFNEKLSSVMVAANGSKIAVPLPDPSIANPRNAWPTYEDALDFLNSKKKNGVFKKRIFCHYKVSMNTCIYLEDISMTRQEKHFTLEGYWTIMSAGSKYEEKSAKNAYERMLMLAGKEKTSRDKIYEHLITKSKSYSSKTSDNKEVKFSNEGVWMTLKEYWPLKYRGKIRFPKQEENMLSEGVC